MKTCRKGIHQYDEKTYRQCPECVKISRSKSYPIWYEKNKTKIKIQIKNWALNNPDKMKQNARKGRLKRTANCTIEQYDQIFMQQNECCAICGKHQSLFKKRLAIDHNHETGKIRGILCDRCNHGLGRFKDDILLLKAAIDYLERH